MTNNEMKEIYETACRGKGYEPNDGQFKIWKQVLGWCEAQDLARALIQWFTDNASFPMPAELKPLSEQARRERVARSSVKLDYVVYQCPVCMGTRSGWPEDPERQRYCMNYRDGSRCGTILQIVLRETPEQYGNSSEKRA